MFILPLRFRLINEKVLFFVTFLEIVELLESDKLIVVVNIQTYFSKTFHLAIINCN